MSLKDIANKSSKIKKETKESVDEDNFEKIMSISLIEGLNSYLYGMYVAYCKFNNIKPLDGEEFMDEFKNIPKLKDEKKRKQFLKNKSKIGNFLIWYIYE